MSSAIPCVYRFENSRIRVEWRGKDKWAITDAGLCLNNRGEWVYEPLLHSGVPVKTCRFSLEEAMRLAEEAAAP